MRIDTSKSFVPLKIVVITISDSRTEKNDKSGQFLTNAVQTAGHEVFAKEIITDDIEKIVKVWWQNLQSAEALYDPDRKDHYLLRPGRKHRELAHRR